jgi:sugar phosphate isomerase/epimerase
VEIICASICYRGYGEDEVASTLEFAPALGYKYMEIHGPMTWTPEAVETFDLPAVQAAIAKSGLKCAGIYTPGWGGADEAERHQHATAIAKCAGFVAALGGDHVTSTGAGTQGDAAALARVGECAREVLAQLPAASPVRLCLEPHFGNVLQDPADFATVLEGCDDPRLGLCVDTGHFNSAHVDTPAFIRQWGPRIYNVHLKDHLCTTSVGIGRGEVDLAAIVAALCEVGYEGGLTVELEVEDPQNLPRYTQEAYVYLHGLLGTKL